jgi:outer membrane murein-binding lipoprotein Lpp
MEITKRPGGLHGAAALTSLLLAGCTQTSTVDSLHTEVNAANQLARDANA